MCGSQIPKNVHDVQKICIRKCSCLLMCLSEFYVIVFIEIDLGCYYDLEDLFWGFNVWVRLHLEPTRGPRRGPQHLEKTAQNSTHRRANRRPVDQEMSRLTGPSFGELKPANLGVSFPTNYTPSMGCLLTNGSSFVGRGGCLQKLLIGCLGLECLVNSPQVF